MRSTSSWRTSVVETQHQAMMTQHTRRPFLIRTTVSAGVAFIARCGLSLDAAATCLSLHVALLGAVWGLVSVAADESGPKPSAQQEIAPADYSTLNSVAKSFGIADEDIKSAPTDLFECLRAVATTGGKHISHIYVPLDPEKLKNDVHAKLDSDNKLHAIQSVVMANSHRVMIRGANGMYESFRQCDDFGVTTLVRGKELSQRCSRMVYDAPTSNVPGEYDRCFFQRSPDGALSLCEEFSTFDDSNNPHVFSETYAIRLLEGTWEDYLGRRFVVVTLDGGGSKQRATAHRDHDSKALSGFRKKWLADEAGLADVADDDFLIEEKSTAGSITICVFGDCLLWVEEEPFLSVAAIKKPAR